MWPVRLRRIVAPTLVCATMAYSGENGASLLGAVLAKAQNSFIVVGVSPFLWSYLILLGDNRRLNEEARFSPMLIVTQIWRHLFLKDH